MDNCIFKDGYVQTSLTGEPLKALYKNLLELFLDGKIGVSKVIGFEVKSDKHLDVAVLNRPTSLLENQIEIAGNISKLVFYGLDVKNCTCILPAGKIYARDLILPVRRVKTDTGVEMKSLQVLNKDTYLFTAVEGVQLNMYIEKACGPVLIKDNNHKMECNSDIKYYPLNSDHDLAPFIRFLPFNGYSIRYRLDKNISEDAINEIIQSY